MILVVEDNAEVAVLIVEALSAAGYETEVAGSGDMALARLTDEARPYDLVLMDLSLPGLNGDEVLRQARAAGVTTPAVAVSGAAALIEPARLAAEGFVEALPKPFRVSALLELVERHLPHAAA